MVSKARFWNAVLVFLSAVNVVSVWFAAQPGEPWHATAHAVLAVGFGLWAQRRMRLSEARSGAGALDEGDVSEIGALRGEVEEARRSVRELEERVDFAERLLSQEREGDRVPRRGET